MKYLQCGLLMILIIALAMPSPLAFAAEALDSSPTDALSVVELETPKITIPPESALKTDTSQSDEISPIESSEILKTATPVISSSLHSNEVAEVELGEFYIIRGGTVVQPSEGDALFDDNEGRS